MTTGNGWSLTACLFVGPIREYRALDLPVTLEEAVHAKAVGALDLIAGALPLGTVLQVGLVGTAHPLVDSHEAPVLITDALAVVAPELA